MLQSKAEKTVGLKEHLQKTYIYFTPRYLAVVRTCDDLLGEKANFTMKQIFSA